MKVNNIVKQSLVCLSSFCMLIRLSRLFLLSQIFLKKHLVDTGSLTSHELVDAKRSLARLKSPRQVSRSDLENVRDPIVSGGIVTERAFKEKPTMGCSVIV